MDFCRAEQDPEKRGRREVIAAPRGNAKTTFKLLIKAIHAIVYEYEKFILIVAHSAPEAVEKVRSILDELEGNQRLLRVYGNLAPVRGKTTGLARWGKKEFITQNGIRVTAKSIGQDIRGIKHGAVRPTFIICDDIESPDGVLSPEQRAKIRDWFFKDLLKCGQVDGSTSVTLIGTVLHQESLLSELLQSSGFQGSRYQSIISYSSRQDLWGQWQQKYTDLSNATRHEDAQAFFEANREEMLEGTAVLWPEGEPYIRLMQMRVDEGVAAFQSEKQNDPFDPDRQIFNMRQAKRFRAELDENGLKAIHWLDGSGKIVDRCSIVKIVAFHDPAFGKKAGQHSEPDYAAIVVAAADRNGYIYCLEAYIEKDSISKQINKAFQLHDKWDLDLLLVETNQAQVLLKDLYAGAEKQRTGARLRIKGVEQTENKYSRISTMEPEVTNGYLQFADTLNPRLIEQMEFFTTSYDDGPDALEGAVHYLRGKVQRKRSSVKSAGPWMPPPFPIETYGGPGSYR